MNVTRMCTITAAHASEAVMQFFPATLAPAERYKATCWEASTCHQAAATRWRQCAHSSAAQTPRRMVLRRTHQRACEPRISVTGRPLTEDSSTLSEVADATVQRELSG